ncbi:MAG: efflux RND transporter permease subunit [Abditibacteriota bacterium]|nr:efflux RND transporter permease subunit [Abditibacteriota bacterium]
MGLTTLAIRRPVVIIMFVIALIVLGLRGEQEMPVELMPKMDLPYVTVMTIYEGAGPNEIETLVSKPIEKAVSSVNNIKNVTSTSREGMSIVSIEFIFGTDTAVAAADVRDKVSSARRQLPDDIEEPTITKADISSSPVMILGLNGDMPLKEMKDYADETLADHFSKLKGVAAVNVFGGEEREINVFVHKDRLQAYNLSITDVVNAIAMSNMNVPAGTIKETKNEYSVRTVGEFESVDQLRDLRFKNDGNLIRLADIADIEDTVAEDDTVAKMNGNPTVIFAIQKQSDANVVEVAREVREEIEELRANVLPDGLDIVIARDTSTYAENALEDVEHSLFEGIILVVIIVFVFLHSARATFIVAIAIPTSLFATFLPISSLGYTLNQMTLLGLSLVVGILVDDSIVVLENIERHLRMRKDPVQASIDGRSEIGLAAITITMVDMVVFLPIAFMGGIVGQVFRQFGVTVAVATGFSLFMSFTLTPMLASRWMQSEEEKEREEAALEERFRTGKATLGDKINRATSKLFSGVDTFLANLDAGYSKLLEWAIDNRYLTIVIGFVSLFAVFSMMMPLKGIARTIIVLLTIGLCAISLFVNKKSKGAAIVTAAIVTVIGLFIYFPFGFNFTPKTDEGQFNVSLTAPPGTSLEEMTRIVSRVSAVVAEIPEVKNGGFYIEMAGNAGGGRGSSSGSNYGSVMATAVPKSERSRSIEDIIEEVREKTVDTPGLELITAVATSSMGGGGMGSWDIQLEVQGNNYNTVYAEAQRILSIAQNNPDVAGADISYKPIQPERRIVLDRIKIAEYGLTLQQVAYALRYAIEGNYNSKYRENGVEYDIRVHFPKEERADVTMLQDMIVGKCKGAPVYLRDVADIISDNAPTEITRKNRQRVIYVYANLAKGANLGNVQNDLLAEGRKGMPSNVTLAAGGMGDVMNESFGFLISALALAIALVYMLMGALFESFLTPFIILFSLPMAMIGALLALLTTGNTLSIMSMIGIIMLMGLVTKNAILLVDYTNTLRDRGMERRDAILEAGPTRLRPILMTTLAMVFGMLPTALALSEGSELRAPMSIAVIGGLIVSTLLTLVVIPVVYTLVDDFWMKVTAGRRKK